MKANIHPNWYPEAVVTCACGNTFTTGSTVTEIRVEICNKCHPLFTGQSKLVDTLGQVQRFELKNQKTQAKKHERAQIEEKRKLKVEVKKADKPSLKELLMQARKQAAS